MKNKLVYLIALLISLTCTTSTVFAATTEYDTGGNNKNVETVSAADFHWWGIHRNTGTRYVFRIYNESTGKYEEVNTKYYINHIYENLGTYEKKFVGGYEQAYFGVGIGDSSGKVRKITLTHNEGKTLFSTRAHRQTDVNEQNPRHIIMWNTGEAFYLTKLNGERILIDADADRNDHFGLNADDVMYLAGLIYDYANSTGDTATRNKMQKVINGEVEFDIRAEILFYMKTPGKNGKESEIRKFSLKNGLYDFYAQMSGTDGKYSWYYTYRECRAIGAHEDYRDGTGFNSNVRGDVLDSIASNLYEKDQAYVFENGVYQCSCNYYNNWDVYKYSSGYILRILGQTYDSIHLRWKTPGYCGVPVLDTNGKTIYLSSTGKNTDLNGHTIKYTYFDSKYKTSNKSNNITIINKYYYEKTTTKNSEA